MQHKADLCFALGTSLSGMNADRVPATVAKKARLGTALGLIIINLQQTPMDQDAEIRIWAKLDDVFQILANKLNILTHRPKIEIDPEATDCFVVPYDKQGNYDKGCMMKLDLTVGAEITIPNPLSMNYNERGVITGKDKEGNYLISYPPDPHAESRLGRWMIDSIQRGVFPCIPIMNIVK